MLLLASIVLIVSGYKLRQWAVVVTNQPHKLDCQNAQHHNRLQVDEVTVQMSVQRFSLPLIASYDTPDFWADM